MMSASTSFNEHWYPKVTWLNDWALSVYPVSFDFAILALTVFNKPVKIYSVGKVIKGSHEPNVKIVTYVKRKTWSKGKAN